MIPSLGHIALILSLLAFAVQSVLPLARKEEWAKKTAAVLFILLSVSFAALVYAYVTSDFSVLNVAENSHTLKPMIYKTTGVWGNHEGSMLLWIWMLSFWGFLVARKEQSPARILCVQGMIGLGFTLFVLFASNPFTRIHPAPHEGMDLNPLLQDIGLAVHPPLLYAGYVGFSVAFCFAMAALAERKIDAGFATRVRPWVLAAWIALTLGITSGAVWAYYELGWGGFWFWDPVENASLLPWLAGTALLHSLAVLEKRGQLGNWVIFLAILAFSMSLLGTFLVRSGLLTSVHAFASDPLRGIFILLLLGITIGGAFLFYAARAGSAPATPSIAPVSRESALLLNNVFLFAFCMTVLTGTLYPVILSALDLGSVSVGAPYYNTTLLPLLVPFAFLTGAAPLLTWGSARLEKISIPAIAVLMALAIFAVLPLPHKFLSLLGLGMGGWIVVASLYDVIKKRKNRLPLSYFGMIIAHAGFGVLILGITATTLWKQEDMRWMKPGDRMEIARQDIAFLGAQEGTGANYARKTAVFSIGSDYMAPEKRWYPTQQKMTSEVAMRIHNGGILYLALGDQDKDDPQRFVVRVYYHPLALFILIGALMIALGGAASLRDRKRA